jgi:glycine/D-amino acid oxidase-like deaminating enzyme
MTRPNAQTQVQWPNSLWANVTPPWPDTARLTESVRADAVVIGAGFTGLSTALSLTSAGQSVVVLEAVSPGWGASGRNNGQVIPTLTRPNPTQIIAKHGEAGERFVQLICGSASGLFDLVREHDIAAEAEQTGWIQPVHTPGRIKIAQERVRQWSAYGAPIELLTPDAVQQLTGASIWHGGLINHSGGHINPLALARGLGQAAVNAGARIYCHSAAVSLSHNGSTWTVTTPAGQVVADALMLATHAYPGHHAKALFPAVAREVVPATSWQLATQPLDDSVREHVIPGRHAVSDTHGDLHFMRYDNRHRLITGGALVIKTMGTQRIAKRIRHRLMNMFPAIGDVNIEYVWNGYLGMTTDYMPRLHKIGPNGYAWAGCNGRGVGLSVALGQEFARAIGGTPLNELALPFSEPVSVPAHGIVRRLAPLRLLQYRWNDRREV